MVGRDKQMQSRTTNAQTASTKHSLILWFLLLSSVERSTGWLEVSSVEWSTGWALVDWRKSWAVAIFAQVLTVFLLLDCRTPKFMPRNKIIAFPATESHQLSLCYSETTFARCERFPCLPQWQLPWSFTKNPSYSETTILWSETFSYLCSQAIIRL